MSESSRVAGLVCPVVIALGSDGARFESGGAPLGFGEVPRGACVALCIEDPRQLSVAYFAVVGADAVPLVINPHLPRATAQQLAASARAWAWLHSTPRGEVAFERFDESRPLGEVAGHVLCTSGTTGRGAVPSMYFFAASTSLANARAHLASLGLGAERSVERMLLPMPLSHSFGLVAGLFAAAALDATLFAFRATPDPSTLLTVLERERIQLLYLTPPLLRLLLKRSRGKSLGDFPELRVVSVGSASVTRAELRGMLRCFPSARGYFTYGLTELGPRVSTFASGTDAEPSACLERDGERAAPLGDPLSGVAFEVRAAGEDGVGELFVSTPFASMGRLREGVLEPLCADRGFATHDAARVTGDAQIELLGRTDGTIVRGGTNVYPSNVERVADSVPGVLGSCLVAKLSPLYGQVPVLFLELDACSEVGLVKIEVSATLARELSATDQPVEIRVLPALPRTALGKVQRGALVAEASEGAKPDGR